MTRLSTSRRCSRSRSLVTSWQTTVRPTAVSVGSVSGAVATVNCRSRPAVVVATPVGFVKAAESRERVREVAAEYDVPAITTVGRRGGSGLAAGLTNELVHVASDAREGAVAIETDATPAGAD